MTLAYTVFIRELSFFKKYRVPANYTNGHFVVIKVGKTDVEIIHNNVCTVDYYLTGQTRGFPSSFPRAD